MTALQIIRGHPYLTIQQIAKETDRTDRTVRNRIKGIKEQILLGRYSPYAYIEDEGLVNWYAYVDFLKWRKQLEDKNLRKSVPDFNPAEIEMISGFKTKVISLEE